WYTRITREDVLEEYKDFGPQFKAFIELAADPINLWQMRGRAAMAAGMLPCGTKPAEVPSRLAAYQDLRKARDEFVTIESLERATVPSKRGRLHNSGEMQDFLNGYDAIAVAEEHLTRPLSKKNSKGSVGLRNRCCSNPA
ncbi:hypothetical protein B0H10DRAFT_2072999, partial [Mycena sp. CBHHK59/15]